MIEMDTVRIILIGKTGSGKSTIGNTLLGSHYFPTFSGFCSPSEKCGWGCISKHRLSIEVTDTPGIFDTYPDTESVHREFVKTVCLASPGPHAILHVVRADCRFTREDYFMYEDMKSMFGESLTRFLILVFNGISQKDFEEKYKKISCLPADLLRIMHEAGGRMVCFSDTRNNTSSRNEVEKLLSSIQNVKKHNNGAFHSNENFRCLHEKMLRKLGNSDIKIHEIKKSMAEERDLWFLE